MSIPKEILAAIGMPETLDTPLGRFAFADGLPADESVDGRVSSSRARSAND